MEVDNYFIDFQNINCLNSLDIKLITVKTFLIKVDNKVIIIIKDMLIIKDKVINIEVIDIKVINIEEPSFKELEYFKNSEFIIFLSICSHKDL